MADDAYADGVDDTVRQALEAIDVEGEEQSLEINYASPTMRREILTYLHRQRLRDATRRGSTPCDAPIPKAWQPGKLGYVMNERAIEDVFRQKRMIVGQQGSFMDGINAQRIVDFLRRYPRAVNKLSIC